MNNQGKVIWSLKEYSQVVFACIEQITTIVIRCLQQTKGQSIGFPRETTRALVSLRPLKTVTTDT
eukprot:13993709-Heterocapsa_arctica.AAC.1